MCIDIYVWMHVGMCAGMHIHVQVGRHEIHILSLIWDVLFENIWRMFSFPFHKPYINNKYLPVSAIFLSMVMISMFFQVQSLVFSPRVKKQRASKNVELFTAHCEEGKQECRTLHSSL